MKNKKQTIQDKLNSININAPKTDFYKIFNQKKEGTTGFDNALLIDVSLIISNPNQPRKYFNKKKLEELADSIHERGILQPIRVRPKYDKYEIIAGERRWQASQLANLKEIPCIVVKQGDKDTYIDALMENIQRENLNPIDRANALIKLRENLGLQSWENVGKRLGIKKRHIFNLLGLKSLPKDIQTDIKNGSLSEKHGRALKSIMYDNAAFNKAYQKIKSDKMSGNEALIYIKSFKQTIGKPEINKDFKAIKTANQQYKNMLLLSDFKIIEGDHKKHLTKELLIIKNIVLKTLKQLEE